MNFWDALGTVFNYGNSRLVGDANTALGGPLPQTIGATAPGASLDTSEADLERGRLKQLLGQLQQQAATGDGAWEDTLHSSMANAKAQAEGLGQSTPGTDYQSALMNIGNAQAGVSQRGAADEQMLRGESMQSAQDQLAQLEPAIGAGDINQAANAAAVAQQKRQANAALAQQSKDAGQGLLSAGGSGAMALLSDGGRVPGVPYVFGDDSRNDTVPAMLSPEEIVVPISASQDPDKAADFARAVAERGHVEHHADGGDTGVSLGAAPSAGQFVELAFAPHVGMNSYYSSLGGGPQAASIENGGLLDTSQYAESRGGMDLIGGQLGERAAGGNSIADAVSQQQSDQRNAEAIAATNASRAGTADVLKATAAAGAKGAGDAAGRRLSDQTRGQRSLAGLLETRRAQEQALAQAQQGAAWNNTMLNAGLTLENQAAVRGQLAAGAQALGSIASQRGGGAEATSLSAPPLVQADTGFTPGGFPTDDQGEGRAFGADQPEWRPPNYETGEGMAHGGLVFDDADDDERHRVRSFLQMLKRAA